MTFLDVIILLPILYGIARGIMRGIVSEAFALVGIALGIIVARLYADGVATWLQQSVSWNPTLLRAVVSFVIFLVVALACKLLAWLLTKVIKLIALNWLNRLVGALFGAVKWILIVTIIIAFVDILDDLLHFIKPELKADSFAYNAALSLAQALKNMIF